MWQNGKCASHTVGQWELEEGWGRCWEETPKWAGCFYVPLAPTPSEVRNRWRVVKHWVI